VEDQFFNEGAPRVINEDEDKDLVSSYQNAERKYHVMIDGVLYHLTKKEAIEIISNISVQLMAHEC
jgi:hypothetical protein